MSRFVITVFVNDVECEGYRDSGSDILIVREAWSQVDVRGNMIRVVDVFGRAKELRTAIISVRFIYYLFIYLFLQTVVQLKSDIRQNIKIRL